MNVLPEKSIIEEVASIKGISESFVEKDWYVTQVIKTVSEITYQDFQIIFTGGTALSKAHNLILRFSEDVDFRVITPRLGKETKSKQKKILSEFKQTIIASFKTAFRINEEKVFARNGNQFFALEIDYPTFFPRADALRPHILVEFTVSSLAFPAIYLPVSSFVNELTRQLPEPVQQKLQDISWSCFSDAGIEAADSLLKQCYKLTDSVFEGLDLTREIQSVSSQNLGETVLLWDEGDLIGMAICHCGPATEAGSGTCYIKFGVVDSDVRSGQHFEKLLIACEQLACKKSLDKIAAGVNTARREAYKLMLANGYTTTVQGVVMQQPDAGYNRENVFLIDDWR